jgi:hypothetical protein
MEFDLQRGLHDLSWAPPVAPDAVPTDRVLARVRRGRALRATAIGAASLALVAGAAVAVVALPRDPIPPVDPPAPTDTPTPTTDPTPTPSPTPSPTPTPEPVDPPIAALTTGGALVLLDPETGAVTSTVYEGLTTSDPSKTSLTVSPDGLFAYASRVVSTEVGTAWEILRVSLASGSADLVAEGIMPAISPDGATLAYAGRDPSFQVDPNFPEDDVGLALVLRDLATGAERYIGTGHGGNPSAWLDQIAWSTDGTTLFVPMGMEGSSLYALDESATDFEGALSLGDDDGTMSESEPIVLADGTLLVSCSPYDDLPDETYVAVIDPLTGSVAAHVEPLAGWGIFDMAARPRGAGLAFLADDPAVDDGAPGGNLYRWDDGGEPQLLGTGFLAVAW